MKAFCPSCEKETNCVYIAELYECKECGCDFESKQRQMQERLDAANARAEAAEAELARLKSLLIAWNLEPDGTYNQPAYWALNSEASKLAWEAYQLALKGGEE